MFNEICPHCKKFYMEPVYVVSDPRGYHEGLFMCPGCLKETFVAELKDKLMYEYPFEGVR